MKAKTTSLSDARLLGASFRDPSGFLFSQEGKLYRQINQDYREEYDFLISSGLYQRLTSLGLMVSHAEVGVDAPAPEQAYKIIQPEHIPFISYPYEWGFSQYRDAALCALNIQKIALKYGMVLKDASAYNIQFFRGQPQLIDTLSFEVYQPGAPWVAYRQFCQHFLAPLALMSHTDIRLAKLMQVYIDGIPLDLASRLLPRATWLNLPIFLHIHLHAKSQQHYANKSSSQKGAFSTVSMLGLIDSLETCVQKLKWGNHATEWGDYYSDTNYSAAAQHHKERIINEFLDEAAPRNVWDLGANTGFFSSLASKRGIPTIAFDIDPLAVEKAYADAQQRGDTNLLPLLLDLTNPSPAIGWGHQERSSLLERGPAHTVMALALIHHLAISNNVPLERLADFFSQTGVWLIIEFVPKTDSQVQRLLAARKDIFQAYTIGAFEASFLKHFTIHKAIQIEDSGRVLYLMEKRERA